MKYLSPFCIPLLLSALVFSGCRGESDPEAELKTMTLEIAEEFDDVTHISTEDLAAWIANPAKKPPQLLDAREPDEYAVSHLQGAIRVAPDATAAQLKGRVDFSRPIVVYCSVGYRSSILTRRLAAAGANQVMNLEGSIFKWANESRPLVRAGEATQLVHPYNRKYGRMLRKEHRSEN